MTIRSMAGQSPMRADLTKNLVGLNPDPCSVERNPTTGDWIRNSVDRSSMTTTAVHYPMTDGSNPSSSRKMMDALHPKPKAARNLMMDDQIRKPTADRYPMTGDPNLMMDDLCPKPKAAR